MRERKYFIVLMIITTILMAIGIVSTILFSINLFNSGKGMDNIFEIILFVFYFAILITALVLDIRAITYGSMIIKAMVYQRNSDRAISMPARVICIIFSVISFTLFGYFFLSLFVSAIPVFNFPIVLIYTIVNVSLTILVYSIFFCIYPYFKERKRVYEKKN